MKLCNEKFYDNYFVNCMDQICLNYLWIVNFHFKDIQQDCGESTFGLNENHPYYDQMQGQLFFFTKKHACDFVL